MSNERFNGTIKYWNARKGFGFISPEAETGDEEKQVFVHIKAFATRTTKPTIGQTVNYVISTDDQGRTRAEDVIKTDEETAPKATSSEEQSSVKKLVITLIVISAAILAYSYLT